MNVERLRFHGPGAAVEIDDENSLLVWAPGGDRERGGWRAAWSTSSSNPYRGAFVEADDAEGVLALLEDRLPIGREDGYAEALDALREYVAGEWP